MCPNLFTLEEAVKLWKESDTSRWVSQAHFWRVVEDILNFIGLLLADSSENFFEVDLTLFKSMQITSHTMLKCNQMVYQRERRIFRTLKTETLAGIMLAYNKLLLLFSRLVISCVETGGSHV